MNIKQILAVSLFSLLFFPACNKSCAKEEVNAKEKVFFIYPEDGQTLTSPFAVKFGLIGMNVRPALEDIKDKKSGHHHILIDHPHGFIEEGIPVPADANHIHYGKGEISTTLNLSPGVHTLSMQFADGAHLSYGKRMATTITVTVTE
jgi:hypothetical protein